MSQSLVLLTRPEGHSRAVEHMAAERGYRCVCNPLLQVVPVNVELPRTGFDAILFTSTNGVRLAAEGLDRHTPVLAVGEHTRDVAAGLGFDATCIGGTVAEAAGWLRDSFGAGKTVLYPSGVHTAADLPSLLAPDGPSIMRVPVYATHCLKLEKAAIDLLYARRIAWILLFSRRSAEALAMAMNDLPEQGWIADTGVCCLSVQVAEPIAGLQWSRVLVSLEPTASAMIAALPQAGAGNSA